MTQDNTKVKPESSITQFSKDTGLNKHHVRMVGAFMLFLNDNNVPGSGSEEDWPVTVLQISVFSWS